MPVVNKDRKKYIKKVKKLLICNEKKRKSIIGDLNNSIDCFLNAHPDADIEMLEDNVGKPEEIAEEFLKNIPVAEIKKRLFIAKCIKLFCAFLIFILMCCFIYGIYELYETKQPHYGVYSTYINIDGKDVLIEQVTEVIE